MGAAIEITIDDAQVRGALQSLAGFGGDMTPLMRAIGGAMETSTRLRFASGTGPDGVPWKPSQRVERHGGQTLVLSRRLERSITSNAGSNQVEWGTGVIYGAIHQFGGKIEREAHSQTIYRKAGKDGIEPRFVKKGQSNFAQDVLVAAYSITIPARPYLGVSQADSLEITALIVNAMAVAATGSAP